MVALTNAMLYSNADHMQCPVFNYSFYFTVKYVVCCYMFVCIYVSPPDDGSRGSAAVRRLWRSLHIRARAQEELLQEIPGATT